MTTEQIIEEIKRQLFSSAKEKIVCLATTADVTNPAIILGTPRETETTIAVTVIFRDVTTMEKIINALDGFTDYFFLDSEVKNEIQNLESKAREKIKKSKILVYKPNDFTVESLDMLMALLFETLSNKKILILGSGNIGSKVALKFCERGAQIFLFGRNIEKTKTIVAGLNSIKRSKSLISQIWDFTDIQQSIDVVLGCTPGVPIVTKEIVEKMNPYGKIIDVGNRTIEPTALSLARERGIEVLSLSSIGGYRGMIENWLYQRDILGKTRSKHYNTFSLITPGVLGEKGDILVDDAEHPQKVYGICDGQGGLMERAEGKVTLESTETEEKVFSKIKEFYT